MDHPAELPPYEQKAMRKHLIESLEKQNITAFPIKKIRRHVSKVRHSANIPIHCVCRLPKLEGIKMIECSYCGIILTYVCQYLQIPNNHIQSGLV